MIGGSQQAAATASRSGDGDALLHQGGSAGRRPWWVWGVPFVMLTTVLVIRNAFLFSTRLYEDGDMASNSLRIEEARHFTLLIGDYSRLRFSHPGPAYLYVQAWGQELLYNLLHLVPTAWNAQVIAVYALNSGFAALAVGVVYGWTRSVRGAAATLAGFAAFAVLHPLILSSDWMSYMYVPTVAVLLIAAASVAAGRMADAWILALAGWFLIHGHAAFLFFVPAIIAVVVVAVVWQRRRTLPASLRHLASRPGVWVPVTVISAVFLLPIAVNLALHWPGDFGKYFSYGSSSRAGGHSARAVLGYLLWFWSPRANAPAPALLVPVPLLLYALAGGLAWRFTRPPVRRFLVSLLAVGLAFTAAFAFYVAVGVDDLGVKGRYIGYFYWAVPLVVLIVIAVALTEAAAGYGGAAVAAVVAAAVAMAAIAGVVARPYSKTPTLFTNPAIVSMAPSTEAALPGAVRTIAHRSPGRTLVIRLDHNTWRDVTGFLVQAKRTGVSACVDDKWWTFMVTAQEICTPLQAATGVRYFFFNSTGPVRGKVLVHLYASRIVAGWPPSSAKH